MVTSTAKPVTPAGAGVSSRVASSDARQQAAYHKLRDLVKSYPADTPDEHILFGYGAVRMTLGDLRLLFV